MKDKPPTGIQKTKNECVCQGCVCVCAKSRVGEGCREDINKMPVLTHMKFKSVVWASESITWRDHLEPETG